MTLRYVRVAKSEEPVVAGDAAAACKGTGQFLPGSPIPMIRLRTHLQPEPPFYLGNRMTDKLGSLLKLQAFDRVFVVTNAFLLGRYGNGIHKVLRDHAIDHRFVTIEASEQSKTFATLEALCETLVEHNVSRSSIIIGFGGGCLTNIAGLAAGLIFHGIRYVEMPSTLMGITDSTLSNMQAVNGRHGKNHFGMYYAPIFIFADTHYLVSESDLGKRCAIAEGIKNGFICCPELVEFFETRLRIDVASYTERDLYDLSYRIIQSKLKILRRDPSEKGYAMTLEYGHTFGHAMEFLTRGRIPHGVAVAKGMCIAAELSYALGHILRDLVDLHYHIFGACLGLDLSMPPDIEVDDILQAMKSDIKKAPCGTKFVLLKRIGECLNPNGDYQVEADGELVRLAVNAYKANSSYFNTLVSHSGFS